MGDEDVIDPGAETLDVPTAQVAVLAMMRLFRALERARPAVTAPADGLVAAGYAQREAEVGDRRVVRLCLTAAGRAALERADAAYADWLGPLLSADQRRRAHV